MKFKLLVFSAMVMISANLLALTIDPSVSTYTCTYFESTGLRVVHIDVADQKAVTLQDGQHELHFGWFDWTLNLNVIKVGQVQELLGAASHLHFKLRSHSPRVSIYCNNDLVSDTFVRGFSKQQTASGPRCDFSQTENLTNSAKSLARDNALETCGSNGVEQSSDWRITVDCIKAQTDREYLSVKAEARYACRF